MVLGESEEIIGDAISKLKFTDAVAVVLGGEDAATNILKRASIVLLKKDIVQNSKKNYIKLT